MPEVTTIIRLDEISAVTWECPDCRSTYSWPIDSPLEFPRGDLDLPNCSICGATFGSESSKRAVISLARKLKELLLAIRQNQRRLGLALADRNVEEIGR